MFSAVREQKVMSSLSSLRMRLTGLCFCISSTVCRRLLLCGRLGQRCLLSWIL